MRTGSAMMSDLYQEMILDHYRSPSNRAATLEEEDAHVHHSNPLCGDEIDVRVAIDDDTLSRVVFDGQGCSICVASASTMTEAVEGKDLERALALIEEFRQMMHGKQPQCEEELGDEH